MADIEITKLSSKGQVVIPKKIRDALKIKDKQRFLVFWKANLIVLEELKIPDFKDINDLLDETPEKEVDFQSEISKISSRGQIVLPKKTRLELNLNSGSKLMIFTKDNKIFLKKLSVKINPLK